MAAENRISTSNTVETIIKSAQISNVDGGFIKSLDKQYADVGDTVTYTITLKNTGNTTANNVVFSDTIPMGSTFVANSVMLNGIAQGGVNPQSGVAVGMIPPGVSTEIKFKVTLVTIPDPTVPDMWIISTPILNQSLVSYTYTTDPANPNGQSASHLSNTVSSNVIYGALSDLTKTTDKTATDISSEVTYTLTATNIGSAVLNNVVIRDTIPNGTTFVQGSVLINGNGYSGNPETGINVGTLQIGDTFTVNFKVSVDTMPTPNPIPNQAIVSYNFIVDPASPSGRSKEELSNYVYTKVNTANITLTKRAFPIYTVVGDVVTYEVALRNSGTVNADDVLLLDTIPSGTTFVENSVVVNGMMYSGNPQTGILVGEVGSDSVSTVTFQVRVDIIPTPNTIINQAYSTYSYIPDTISGAAILGNSLSNQTTNVVVNGDITPYKVVDKDCASMNEVVTYTLEVTNTGNIPLNNVVIYDTIPEGTTLVPGSVFINGMPQPGANLNNGVGVGSLGILATSQVVFQVTIDSMSQLSMLTNNFDTSAQFVIDPSLQNVKTIRKTSNDVMTGIRDANIGCGPNSFSKVPDKYFVDLGDTITYTVFLKNTGNVAGNNVILKDNIPDGTVFIDDSVVINGTGLPGFNPSSGILLGTINPNDSVTITFQVVVMVVPTPNVINNQAFLSYTYTKCADYPDCEYVTGTSIETEVIVNHGEVLVPIDGETGGFTKTADKSVTERGEIITYCINIPNSGNVPINNVLFKDTIPEGTVLVNDSVILDGGVLMGGNPEEGILVGVIDPGETSNVYFKVKVETIPSTNYITSIANVNYTYLVDPSIPEINAYSNSNTVLVRIGDAQIDNIDDGFIKYVSKDMAEIGDILTYSLRLKNTGNVEAIDALIIDTIPQGSIFVQGSVSINGVSRPTLDPSRGIGVVCIIPNEVVTVTFNTVVKSIPKGNLLKNSASISYEYKNVQNKPPISGHGNSNEVITEVRSVNLSGDNFTKTASEEYGTIGDIVTYTIGINNTGNINAENVWLFDTIANGSVFIDNTIQLNGMSYSGGNPQDGIYIGTIIPKTPQTITFKVRIESIPIGNIMLNTGRLSYESRIDNTCVGKHAENLSNTTSIIVKSPNINISKSANVSATVVGEVVTYRLVIINTGNIAVDNFILSDKIPSELEFIQGSITINGALDISADIIAGVDLGTIYPNMPIDVEFKVTVVERPSIGIVTNRAIAFYYFTVDPNVGSKQGEAVSNDYLISIEVESLLLTKTADTDLVVLGDTITYTVEVENNGSISLTDVVIIDKFPGQLVFVKNSLVVNGSTINSVDIQAGINIGTLKNGEKATIKYQGVMTKACGSCLIENEAYGVYNFRPLINVEEKSGTSEIASVIVKSTSPTFKEICLDGILCIPKPKVGIQEVDLIEAEVDILNYHIVKTIKGVSEENKRLTGYKLIVNGVLRQIMEYTSCDKLESIHSAKFERKFSSFIVLPEDYEEGAHIEASGIVEDVYYNKLNDREVFSNITILLEANHM